MAVQDLWRDRHGAPTRRDGRGLRWRVVVAGWPTTACRTRAEAERLNAVRLTTAPPRPEDGRTVGDLVDVWLDGKRGLSPAGYDAAALAASHVRSRWARTPIDQVTASEVQVWIAGLTTAGGPASSSLRHQGLQCLRGALRDRLDLSTVTAPREVRRDVHPLTMDQLRLLAAEVDTDPAAGESAALVWLLGTTGLRIGEALALNVGDVDERRGRVRVHRSKTGRARDVPVPASVIAMLDLDGPADRPLLRAHRGGRIAKDSWRERRFRPACDRLGWGDVRIHDLRHTAASLAIASGADVLAVQRMLGHRSATMTLDLYGHLWDQGLDDVASRMDRLMSDSDTTRAVPGSSD
ncbi:tyrosine-type recombinase/integrase [Acidipropionibacterium timonense]|uniref:tyrosine-type recombinase/integrase n=1 Tax=Acidipropionibacterium timonense TaxID=2161818 RepID=UPI00103113E9|nr:site-specific integrase [Acidipropionibacterium timonense]